MSSLQYNLLRISGDFILTINSDLKCDYPPFGYLPKLEICRPSTSPSPPDVLSPLETSFLQSNPAYSALCNSFRKRLRVTLSALALDVNHAIERRHQEAANGIKVDENKADELC